MSVMSFMYPIICSGLTFVTYALMNSSSDGSSGGSTNQLTTAKIVTVMGDFLVDVKSNIIYK
jgi:hypothetical protein